MPDYTRREFAETILKSLTLYSFVGAAISSQAMDSALRYEAKVWSAQINEISIDLRARRLTPLKWQCAKVDSSQVAGRGRGSAWQY